jgi:hypothetical protein
MTKDKTIKNNKTNKTDMEEKQAINTYKAK